LVLAAVGFASVAAPARAGAPVPAGLLAAAASGQGGGTIKGKLIWGGEQAPEPLVLVPQGGAKQDPAVCAANGPLLDQQLLVDPATKGVKYAIVYLVNPKGVSPDAASALLKASPTVVIDQKNCEFLPFATALHQDQTVIFKSSDPVNHNVNLTPFTNTPFNTILAANGQTTKKLVAERRPIPMKCDIHPWMKGYLMVFDHPYFAVTGPDGSFELKDVPAGEHHLVIWQASVGYVNDGRAKGQAVTVTPGQTTEVPALKLDPAKIKKS
jgi:hypothetical protein